MAVSKQIRIRRRMPGVPKDIAALARKAQHACVQADPLAWRIVAELARRGWVIRPGGGSTRKGRYFAVLEANPSDAAETARLFPGRQMSPHEIEVIINSDGGA